MFRNSATYLLLISLIPSLSTADFTFVDPTTNCQTTDVNGRAIYCCDGKCYDHTSIKDSTGQCSGFNSACLDPPSVPRCATNQVYTNVKDATVDAGLGNCYISNECQWVRDIYTYSCCDCPEGFIAFHSYCDGPGGRYISFCIGCNGAGENLSFDENTGAYSCAVGPGTIVSASTSMTTTSSATPVGSNYCNLATAVDTANTIISDASSFAGVLCKFDGPLGIFASLAAGAATLAATYLDPGKLSDPTANIYGLALAIGVTVAVIAGSPAEISGLAFGAVLVDEFAAFCNANTVFGLELTSASAELSDYEKKNCPDAVPRSLTHRRVEQGLDTRAAASNPCAELVALFPMTNYSIASDAQTACIEDLAVDASTVGDEGLKQAITGLQQACNSIANLTFLVNFQNLLKAVKQAVPYCEGIGSDGTLIFSKTSTTQSATSRTSHTTKSTTKTAHTTMTKSTHTTKSRSTYTTKTKPKSTHTTKTRTTHAPTTKVQVHDPPYHTKKATSCL